MVGKELQFRRCLLALLGWLMLSLIGCGQQGHQGVIATAISDDSENENLDNPEPLPGGDHAGEGDSGNSEDPLVIDEKLIPEEFLAHVTQRLPASRYLERNCVSANFDNWEGFPLQKCSYQMRDGSQADVILLNPSPLQLAAWIVDSCEYVGQNHGDCYDSLFRSVLFASGGQFPVSGVVYEDLNGNGRYEAYVFRDGVTAKVSSISTGTEKALTHQQIEDALYANVSRTYRYARIVSTTREQYYNYMDVEGLEAVDVGFSSASLRKNTWMDVIRETYQEAWGRRRNLLMRAWALSNTHALN